MLILDELGFLPIDKTGADLLFRVISQRYEQGPIVITSNRAYKDWPEIFNNDSTLTSAILDRLLHHAETILILGITDNGKGMAANAARIVANDFDLALLFEIPTLMNRGGAVDRTHFTNGGL